MRYLSIILFSCLSSLPCAFSDDNIVEKIVLPPKFSISYYARGLPNARSLALGPNGTVFVGTRTQGGSVYAVRDNNSDGTADETIELVRGLDTPNGVAVHGAHLYIAEINRIIRISKIEQNLRLKPRYEVVYDKLPTQRYHGWKYIGFGPDNMLYVAIGVPCNVCQEDNPEFGSIARMKPDGSSYEIFANGIRSSVGFDWHPKSKELWFTDNGRDMLGDDSPPDELNSAPQKGMHFGFPFCHGGTVLDPQFGAGRSCESFIAPVQNLQPHTAALGMRFYTGQMFPSEYRDQIFIAEHGSWNRSSKVGYRITAVKFENNKPVTYQPFASGWVDDDTILGRPVDLLNLPDGSLLVSDDFHGVIYRIAYVSLKAPR